MKPKILALLIFVVVYTIATLAAWKESKVSALKKCPMCGALKK